MPHKRRLPILALTLAALAGAAPREATSPASTHPTRLANDFVYRTLAKETTGNVAIAPGGPLAGLAGLETSGQILPELAERRVGGSAEAAEKLLRMLGQAERGLNGRFRLSHARSAWLEEAPSAPNEVVQVRPFRPDSKEASQWIDSVAGSMRSEMKIGDPRPSQKPTALAAVSAFEASNNLMLHPVGPVGRLRWNGKPVETLHSMAESYSADFLAETVRLPLAHDVAYRLILAIPREDRNLDELMPELGARIEAAAAAAPKIAKVNLPRIAMVSDLDAADPLGLAKANVAAQTRTSVVIGDTFEGLEAKLKRARGGQSSVNLPIWRSQMLPMSSLGSRSSGRTTSPEEIPAVDVNRPFAFAIIEPKSRTIVVAGVVRSVEPVEPAKASK